VPQVTQQHTFPNGLTLLLEPMPHVRSAAFSFLMPAGCRHDPPGKAGLATVLAELITRGAGNRDSRELSDALDRLGLDRSESSGIINMHFSGSLLARNLPEVLEIYADILRRPHLPGEELEAAQALVVQQIQSLEDEPQSKVMVELRRRYYPDPLGRDHRGTIEGVQALTIEDVNAQHAQLFHPRGMALAVAGDVQWDSLREQVARLFGDWQPRERSPEDFPAGSPTGGHLTKDLEQTQIALAYPSVPIRDPDFYNARGAIGVLSLDMSSRLFTNVREKHGLCYSVYASYETFRDRGTIVAYAGARPEKAQETLERTIHELRALKDGIEEEEVERVKIGLKSALIMRQESTGARVSQLSSDWYFLGRVRPLEEIQAAINGLSVPSILGYVEKYPAKDFTVVTLGPEALSVPSTKY
jgi:predicted Zn-dependent peptidase